jgi:hypothetical protein
MLKEIYHKVLQVKPYIIRQHGKDLANYLVLECQDFKQAITLLIILQIIWEQHLYREVVDIILLQVKVGEI